MPSSRTSAIASRPLMITPLAELAELDFRLAAAEATTPVGRAQAGRSVGSTGSSPGDLDEAEVSTTVRSSRQCGARQ